MMRIKDAFSLSPGLFQLLQEPLWEDRYESFDLDLEFLTKYGEKPVAPMVTYFSEDEPLTEQQASQIINLIYRRYKDNWSRKYELLNAEYDLLKNYDMTETELVDRDSTATDQREETRNGTRNQTQMSNNTNKRDFNFSNVTNKTGTDSVTAKNTTETQEDTTMNRDGTSNDEGSDTLTFEGRTDTETRELLKQGDSNKSVTEDGTSTLTFNDRKDTEQRDLTETTDNTTSIDGTTNETGNTSENTEDLVWGFNSTSPVPSEESTSENEEGRNIVEDRTTTENGTKTDKGNVTTGKTGSEVTTKGNEFSENSHYEDRDDGTIANSKTGSEINTKTNTNTSTETSKNVHSGSLNEDGTQTTTYDTEDNNEQTGMETVTNFGDSKHDTTDQENTTGKVESVGNTTEDRTLNRSGNAGVKSSAELLQEHLDFWKWNFLDDVFQDVSDMLTLSIYS